MYADKFVVAIKANGKILKETKDLVHLPFGSEFSVLVKNLNSRRAKFTLNIDGTDVLDGEEIIVGANSEVEMKRFIRNGNMDEGNAFKFIERTAKIEEGPRGIKMDDGVVRVQFWFEKQVDTVVTTTHHHKDVWWDDYYGRRSFWSPPYYGGYTTTYTSNNVGGNVSGSIANVKLGNSGTLSNITSSAIGTRGVSKGMVSNTMSGVAMATSGPTAQAMNASTATFADESGGGAAYASNSMSPTMDSFEIKQELANEAGITVPGSKVDQKFTPVYGFTAEEVSNVIIIRMAGKVGEAPVAVAVVARAKQKCTTCGHVNKAHAKFCGECGTSLDLV